MKKKCLFIDVGSTNIKWGIYNGCVITKEGVTLFPHPVINEYPFFEVDIDEIIKKIKDIIDLNKDEVTDLLFSVQMHGYILTDEEHVPLTNYISWRDKRGLNYLNKVNIPKTFGVSNKPNLPRTSILYFKDKKTDVYQNAKHLFSLGSYIIYSLLEKNVTHITDAASLGFYDCLKRAVDNDTHINVPIPYHDIKTIGKYKGINIYPPLGDHQVSIYACDDENSYIMNLGTSGQVCLSGKELISGDFESRPYFNKYLYTITNIPGGQYIRDHANDENLNEYLFQIYNESIKKLPKRDSLVVTGGALKYHFKRIDEFLNRLDIKYSVHESNALNGLIKLWEEKVMKRKIGVMLSELYSPNIPVLFKSSGYDFFIIDYEHGGFNYDSIAAMITIARLSDIKCLVRLSDNGRKDITKFLDIGADGLILPMTNTKEDINKVVEHGKYYPIGKRGISATRAHSFYNPPKDFVKYMGDSNERVKIYAQIETIEGVNNIDSILKIDGLDGIFFGPNDLACNMGLLDNPLSDSVLRVMEEVTINAKSNKKMVGTISGNKKIIDQAINLDMDFICVGSELSLIKNGGLEITKNLK